MAYHLFNYTIMIIERSDDREISYLAYQKAATRLTKLFSLKPRDRYQKVKEYLENELQDICHSPDEWKEVKKAYALHNHPALSADVFRLFSPEEVIDLRKILIEHLGLSSEDLTIFG